MSSTDSGDGDSRDTGEESSDAVDPAQPPLFDLIGDPEEYGVDDAGNPLDIGSGFGDLWAMDGDDIPDSDPITDHSPTGPIQRGRRLFGRRGASASPQVPPVDPVSDPVGPVDLGDARVPTHDDPERSEAVQDTAMATADDIEGDENFHNADPETGSSNSEAREASDGTDDGVDSWLTVTDEVDHQAAAGEVTERKRRRFGWLRAQPAPQSETFPAGEPGDRVRPVRESPGPIEDPIVPTPDESPTGATPVAVADSFEESPDELTRIPLIPPPAVNEDPQPLSAPFSEAEDPLAVEHAEPPTLGVEETSLVADGIPDTTDTVRPTEQVPQSASHLGDVFDIEADRPSNTPPGDAAPGSPTEEFVAQEGDGRRISSTLSVVPPAPSLSAVPDDPSQSTPYSVDSFDDFAFDFEDLISQPPDEPELDPSGVPLAQWPEDGSATAEDEATSEAVEPGATPTAPNEQNADAVFNSLAVGGPPAAADDWQPNGGSDEPADGDNVIPEIVLPEDDDDVHEYEHVEVKPGTPVDVSAYTSDEYVQASTAEHEGLARAIAEADERGSEHAALYAALPGTEDEVLGLEDVVDMTMEQASVGLAKPAPPSDIAARVGTGIGLIAVVALALLNASSTGILAFVAFGVAALEYYTALQRAGARPVTWAGLLGIAGAFLGTWAFGLVAVPVAVVLSTIAAALFLSFKPTWPRPGVNLAFTMLGIAWIGGSGSLVFAILRSPNYRVLVAVVILLVMVLDVAQYFSGRALGKRPLAPIVSPKKTVEGLVGGYIALAVAGLVLSRFAFWDQTTVAVLVVAIGIVAPFGDLSVSVIKRSLRMKDMGVVLPGHGGVLDRIDALLFAIPVAWIVFSWAGLM
ncbi:Phosphatidate cytidylyltransferase [hydrothermal vent metagenome]|uniref:Phosphatidate cytidylyltransferase n=1 Tax=hydrothermal vent metagenome TaxID=652676 RepID=A0A3B0SBB4_9ZZZZ